MKLVYFLVSEDAIIDERSNKVSLIKIVERLLLPPSAARIEGNSGIKWTETRLMAVCCFSKEENEDFSEGDPDYQLSFTTPLNEVPPVSFASGFRGKNSSRSYIELPGLPDHGNGDYYVNLSYPTTGGQQSVSWHIQVEYRDLEGEFPEIEFSSVDELAV